MKASEFRKLIREEVRRALKEAEATTLSALQVGDQFKLKQDATVAPWAGSYYKKMSASQVSDVVFTVLVITPTSVVCSDGKFQGGSISSPVDLTRQLPNNLFYGENAKATKMLNPAKGTTYKPDPRDTSKYEPVDYLSIWNVIVFKPAKGDTEVQKVGQLSA